MRVLVLGGSWFLGRAVVEAALARGHQVTTFNRGWSGVDVAGAETARGDREDHRDLQRLVAGRDWDAVVDTSGQIPSVVNAAVAALNQHAARYAFVSTVSVYTGWPDESLTEDAEIYDCPPDADHAAKRPVGRSLTGYGVAKAGCERAVRERFDGHTLIVRPGVILGPYEYVGRLPWWLTRAAQGGEMLAPGQPDRPMQPIDVRDVAEFILRALEQDTTGMFNLTAPLAHTTMGAFLGACVAATGAGVQLVWVEDQFLAQYGVKEWTELPLWRPAAGVWAVDASRAHAAGLVCRPIGQTVADTWAWLRSGESPVAHARRSQHGIASDKEQRLLALWRRKPL